MVKKNRVFITTLNLNLPIEHYSLDKENTSYDDLLDALRLALKGFELK